MLAGRLYRRWSSGRKFNGESLIIHITGASGSGTSTLGAAVAGAMTSKQVEAICNQTVSDLTGR